MTVYYMSYHDYLPQLVLDYYRVIFPMLSHIHVVKQDIVGIHRHLVFFFFLGGGGDWEERCCLELYSWGVEVLTTID